MFKDFKGCNFGFTLKFCCVVIAVIVFSLLFVPRFQKDSDVQEFRNNMSEYTIYLDGIEVDGTKLMIDYYKVTLDKDEKIAYLTSK